MSTLGEMLRERRLERRWSLEDVAQRTRIRREYIEALEEGNYAALPADVHVRGFLRNCALALNLPPQEVLTLYQQERGEPELASIAPLVFVPKPRGLALPSLWFVIFATVIMAVCAYWIYYGVWQPTTPIPTATLPPPTPTNILPTATATVRVVLTPSIPDVTGTPTAAVYQGVEAVFVASADCWVRVEADNALLYEGVLRAGTTRTFTATEVLRVRMGNAGGVRVTLNGRDLGVLGQSGQVLDQVWEAEP